MGGKRASPLTLTNRLRFVTPPCSFRELPILAMIGKLYGIKFPSSSPHLGGSARPPLPPHAHLENRRIIAKLFIK